MLQIDPVLVSELQDMLSCILGATYKGRFSDIQARALNLTKALRCAKAVQPTVQPLLKLQNQDGEDLYHCGKLGLLTVAQMQRDLMLIQSNAHLLRTIAAADAKLLKNVAKTALGDAETA